MEQKQEEQGLGVQEEVSLSEAKITCGTKVNVSSTKYPFLIKRPYFSRATASIGNNQLMVGLLMLGSVVTCSIQGKLRIKN
ncbi:MAG: hypothetical protein ACI4B3_04535 [Prevotella sp.]